MHIGALFCFVQIPISNFSKYKLLTLTEMVTEQRKTVAPTFMKAAKLGL